MLHIIIYWHSWHNRVVPLTLNSFWLVLIHTHSLSPRTQLSSPNPIPVTRSVLAYILLDCFIIVLFLMCLPGIHLSYSFLPAIAFSLFPSIICIRSYCSRSGRRSSQVLALLCLNYFTCGLGFLFGCKQNFWDQSIWQGSACFLPCIPGFDLPGILYIYHFWEDMQFLHSRNFEPSLESLLDFYQVKFPLSEINFLSWVHLSLIIWLKYLTTFLLLSSWILISYQVHGARPLVLLQIDGSQHHVSRPTYLLGG